MAICMGPVGDKRQASPASLVPQLSLLRKLRRLKLQPPHTPYSCPLGGGNMLALQGGRNAGFSSSRTPAGPKQRVNRYNGSSLVYLEAAKALPVASANQTHPEVSAEKHRSTLDSRTFA